jgi:hypothetical protein
MTRPANDSGPSRSQARWTPLPPSANTERQQEHLKTAKPCSEAAALQSIWWMLGRRMT